MSLLNIKNLKTNFYTDDGIVQAVRGIDINVEKGEAIGIVGESGCGKSVSMLSTLKLLPHNGEVTAESINFDGIELKDKSSRFMRSIQGNRIGMIFQDPMTSLNPLFTIKDQLTEPLKIHLKMGRKEAEKRAVEMLDLVQIPSPEKRLKQYPHEFSGGMRQRVMIAIAMACNPNLLIADEPTTALDVTIQAQILDLMRDLKNQFGTSIILITHDLGVIVNMCSRVYVMYGGLIIEEGNLNEIFYESKHPYTLGLLKSLPKTGEEVKKKLTPIPGTPPDLLNPPVGCPFVARCEHGMKICKLRMPERTEITETHKASCWLLHEKARGLLD